jgi:hypothetical protein
MRVDPSLRATTAVLLLALAGAAATSWMAGANLARVGVALAVVYVLGSATGSLLVDPRDDRATLSLVVVRMVAGLFLATIGFFLSLLLSLPWFSGPVALLLAAVVLRGRAALIPPPLGLTLSWDGVFAGLLSVALLAPIVLAAVRMAPGEFPPVFYNVDTAYFLEKVHALVTTDTFPPDSLGVSGGRHTYHFGAHGLTALIVRSSAVAPHHGLFLIALPLLTVGVLAAAVVAARSLGPALPVWVTVPMLLVPVPTLWYPFWATVGPGLLSAASSLDPGPLVSLADYQVWNTTNNQGHNVAAHFIVLASLAGIASAPSRGWRLPVFLIGTGILFKVPAGVALAAGFSCAQGYRAMRARSLRPLMPALAATAVFAAVYGAFWVAPPVSADATRIEVSPFFHARLLANREALPGFGADLIWLLLPAGVLLCARLTDRDERSAPLLCFAFAPFVVVNALSLTGTFQDDWPQVLLTVPLVVHAFVLSMAGQRWTRLGQGVKSVFLVLMALTVLPAALVAVSYARVLVVRPKLGHEFVDNRLLGEALSTIPRENTIIVTNDLRYPAEGFSRDDRQMQIPALFGHQAFAVNFAYETYPFSDERRAAQNLLREAEWSEAIEEAARRHRWTHLLIREDYIHPALIPLERVFDNGTYSVFRFPAS